LVPPYSFQEIQPVNHARVAGIYISCGTTLLFIGYNYINNAFHKQYKVTITKPEGSRARVACRGKSELKRRKPFFAMRLTRGHSALPAIAAFLLPQMSDLKRYAF